MKTITVVLCHITSGNIIDYTVNAANFKEAADLAYSEYPYSDYRILVSNDMTK